MHRAFALGFATCEFVMICHGLFWRFPSTASVELTFLFGGFSGNRAYPISHPRRWQDYGFQTSLPRPHQAARAWVRPPIFGAGNFPACAGLKSGRIVSREDSRCWLARHLARRRACCPSDASGCAGSRRPGRAVTLFFFSSDGNFAATIWAPARWARVLRRAEAGAAPTPDW